jgi:pyruvate dehydrogenase E2 component (dihydrolipoamide acetyltransferase)
MNATLEGDQLRQHLSIHLGLAVAAPDGLLVPVIHKANLLSLADLARSTRELSERARTNACSPSELRGSTFSLTTLGKYDIDAFTPILNPPEVGILGIGRVREVIVPANGQPSLGHAMALSLTVDHRAIDGAPAAEFLQTVKRLIEAPGTYAKVE